MAGEKDPKLTTTSPSENADVSSPPDSGAKPEQTAGETVTLLKAVWEKSQKDLEAMKGRVKKIDDEKAEDQRRADEEAGNWKKLYEEAKAERTETAVKSTIQTALVQAGVSSGIEMLVTAARPLVTVKEDGSVEGVDDMLKKMQTDLPGAFGQVKKLSNAPGGEPNSSPGEKTKAELIAEQAKAIKEGASREVISDFDRKISLAK